jgi:tight adherence protein B
VTGIVIMAILAAALVGQAAWLGTDMLRDGDGRENQVSRRLESYTDLAWTTDTPQPSSLLRRRRFSRFPWLERLLKKANLGEALSRDLKRAGLSFGPGEFLFGQLLLTTLAGFAAYVIFPTLLGGVAPAGGAALIAFAVPRLWLRWRQSKRLALFEAALPDALDLIASSLRAGYGLADGLDLVAREDNGPCSEEFAQVVQEIRIGADMDSALVRLAERVDSEDVRLLGTAIAVQRRTGGNLVDVLQQIAKTLRERQRLKAEVRVLTTMPRVSGYVVAALPVAMALMMYFTSPKNFTILITDPIGHAVLGGSAVMVSVGLFLNHRIASVEM